MGNTSSDPETRAVQGLVQAMLQEQVRKRRWSVFFRALLVVYATVVLGLQWQRGHVPSVQRDHVAVLELEGMMARHEQGDVKHVIAGLEQAYANPHVQAVVLRLNSPGGSAVQATRLYEAIQRGKQARQDIKTYGVVEDVCASACYFAGAAVDELYASRASLLGSIGVLINGYGFVDTLHKLGVERRLITAGNHKGFLDPFSPMSPSDRHLAERMLQSVHDDFIARVKQGRGSRLKVSSKVFSGLPFTGLEAQKVGLVDHLGTFEHVVQEVLEGQPVQMYNPKGSVWDRLAYRLQTVWHQTMAYGSHRLMMQ